MFLTLLFLFKKICFRNLESYENLPDVKISYTQMCGHIQEKFGKESPAAEEVLQGFERFSCTLISFSMDCFVSAVSAAANNVGHSGSEPGLLHLIFQHPWSVDSCS